jgi:hypothetical protein
VLIGVSLVILPQEFWVDRLEAEASIDDLIVFLNERAEKDTLPH